MTEKKLTDRQLLGEQGASLISLAVSRMGYVWRPTSQHDTGVDGEIEIRDSVSGAVTGLIIKVQSKAVSTLDNETADGFDYWPIQRDVQYWLGHNVPVILAVSRPATDEVYWQTVQVPKGEARPKKFHFDKVRDRMEGAAKGRLAELAKSGAPGTKGFALSKPELLTSNLLPVARLPDRLYLGESLFTSAKDVVAELIARDVSVEFVLKNKRILTVCDITNPKYHFLCDRGTVEDFGVSEWANTADPDKQRDFVYLLNQCLRQFLRKSTARLRRDRESGAYFFPSNSKNTQYQFGYRGKKKSTARWVVKALTNKKEGHVMGFRHSAMFARFQRFAGMWFLEVNPAYIFTQPDGKTRSRFHSDWLSGIKRLEHNSSILGQLVMWEEILRSSEDLFSGGYPHLGFDRLLSFQIDRGIDDGAWAAFDERDKGAADGHPLGLFDLL